MNRNKIIELAQIIVTGNGNGHAEIDLAVEAGEATPVEAALAKLHAGLAVLKNKLSAAVEKVVDI
jgi:hypothetical protein